MAGVGRISILVSKDMQRIVLAARALDAAVRKQLRAQTRRVVEPIFQEEMRDRAELRVEFRTLVDTARVSVSDSNVLLKSAQVGTLSSGTRASTLSTAAEFGMPEGRKIVQRSKRGKRYERRVGPAFRGRNRRGWVFFPSVQAFIPRAAALWWQTTYRTVAETFEKGQR